MKKLFFGLLILIVSLVATYSVSASHIIGSELTYTCKGGSTYSVKLIVYRDCTGVTLSTPTVFITDGSTSLNINDWNRSVFNVSPSGDIFCSNSLPTNCTERYVFESTVEIPQSSNSYILSYEDSARNGAILNLNGGNGGGSFRVTARIPPSNGGCNNSSPIFDNYSPIILCANEPYIFSHSATDLNGDQIIYSLCDPLIGEFYEPYSASNQIGGTPALTINPNTGLITGFPETPGRFLISVCAEEYRGGTLINTHRREFQINVTDQCNTASGTGQNCCTELYNDMPTGHYSCTAVAYLTEEGVISGDGNTGTIRVDDDINRAELAKIAYLGADIGNTNQFAEFDPTTFPCPFSDLLELGTVDLWYYEFAKTLSYLVYDDYVSPYDRNRPNFFPADSISRAYTLKVLMETWDIPINYNLPTDFNDVPPFHEGYAYISTAESLGILNGGNNNNVTFRPNDFCTRGEAFVFLYNIMFSLQTALPNPSDDDLFIPVNYNENNYQRPLGLADGNFNHYTKTSFAIPGFNLPMVFEHSYNSYLTEMPEQIYAMQPLGVGWTHTYNSYIVGLPGGDYANGADAYPEDRLMVVWPNGSIHAYLVDGTKLTLGNYDEFTVVVPGQEIQIKKKSQIVYTYKKLAIADDPNFPFVLTAISDRNNNNITINHEVDVAGNGVRISRIDDTSGARSLTFNYYPNTNLLSAVTDPLGRTIAFDYDDKTIYKHDYYIGENYPLVDTYIEANLTRFTDAKNNITSYGYGNNTAEAKDNLLKNIQLPKGNYITNSYNGNKRIASTQYNNETPVQLQYEDDYNAGPATGSALNTSTQYTNQRGKTYTRTNNVLGQVTQLTDQSGTLDLSFQYLDPTNQTLPSLTKDSKGEDYEFEYDAMGNVTKITKPLGIFENYTYDAMNNPTSFIDGNGNLTTMSYDGNGNLTAINDPNGGTTQMSYTPRGQVANFVNPSGVNFSFAYDSYGNQTNVDGPAGLGINSTMDYDAVGRMIVNTNPNGQPSIYQYDDNDNVTTQTYVYNTNYAYDVNDNLTSITNAQGNTTNFSYDDEDRVQTRSFQGDTDAYTYEDNGLLNTYTDPNGYVNSYIYDDRGRLLSDGYATYTYDDNSNINTCINNFTGQTLTYAYDALNRLREVVDYYNNVVQYQYDNNNNITQITYPGGLAVNYTYDANNNLKTVTDWNGQTTTYNYRADNLPTEAIYGNSTKTLYGYDIAGRINYMSNQKGDGSIINEYNFALDPMGNHTTVNLTEPLPQQNLVCTANTFSYQANNRINTANIKQQNYSFTHDANGNMTTKNNGTTTDTYTYDTRDMLTNCTKNDINYEFGYDGMRHRRMKRVNGIETRYVLDVANITQVLMETDAHGTPINYYVYGLGLISRVKPTGDTQYYHCDFRGSTIAMTDASQLVVQAYVYDDWGKVRNELNANDDNPFKYVGQLGVMYERNDLYYMRARYYDNEIGRFISEDPIWFINLYPYSLNNPISHMDPSGKIVPLIGVAIGVAVKGAVIAGITHVTIESGKTVFESISLWRRGEQEAAMKLLDSPFQGHLDIIFNKKTAQNMLIGGITGGLGTKLVKAKWMTKIFGKTGILGKIGIGIDMRTKIGILLKEYGGELQKGVLIEIATSILGEYDASDTTSEYYQNLYQIIEVIDAFSNYKK